MPRVKLDVVSLVPAAALTIGPFLASCAPTAASTPAATPLKPAPDITPTAASAAPTEPALPPAAAPQV